MKPHVDASILLLPGSPVAVRKWLAQTVSAVSVHNYAQYTAIVPHACRSQHFRDAAALLFGRPLPMSLRPALGVRLQNSRMIVMTTARKAQARSRWLIWQDGYGLTRSQLPQGTIGGLVSSLQAPSSVVAPLTAILNRKTGIPLDMAQRMLELLGMPGADLLRDSSRISRKAWIEPLAQSVERFDKAVVAKQSNDQEYAWPIAERPPHSVSDRQGRIAERKS